MEKTTEKLEQITRYFDGFTAQQLNQFQLLEQLYTEWNSQINVISRKDMDSLYLKHVLHSLSIAALFTFRNGTHVLDLGTGGGFPGIPLAIYYPEVQFHLVDSIGKKIKVVNAVKDALALKNVTTLHGRAEEISNRKFETVVSRAVAPLKELWFWSKPLIRREPVKAAEKAETGNGLICLKGGDLAQEISESGCKPRIMEITELFDEEYFKEKYVLYVPV